MKNYQSLSLLSTLTNSTFQAKAICHLLVGFLLILYLKFKLSDEKTAFVPRDNVIFYGISLKFMISQSSVGYYNIPRQTAVGYYSIPRVTRGHHALKQYGVRKLLFVISYFRTEYLI
jgi:hypothetical protein